MDHAPFHVVWHTNILMHITQHRHMMHTMHTFHIWQGSRMRLGVTAKVRRIWKWSNGVKISEMGIFWCISITNNVNSCKKFNEKAQMANFSVLAKGRRPRQELFAKKHGKLGKLKRKLLNILKRYGLSRVVPWESWRPEHSENVLVFQIFRF